MKDLKFDVKVVLVFLVEAFDIPPCSLSSAVRSLFKEGVKFQKGN